MKVINESSDMPLMIGEVIAFIPLAISVSMKKVSQKVREDRLPVGRVVFELLPVPLVAEQSHGDLVGEHPGEGEQGCHVGRAEDEHEGEVHQALAQVVRARDQVKQPSLREREKFRHKWFFFLKLPDRVLRTFWQAVSTSLRFFLYFCERPINPV